MGSENTSGKLGELQLVLRMTLVRGGGLRSRKNITQQKYDTIMVEKK